MTMTPARSSPFAAMARDPLPKIAMHLRPYRLR